jgi:hypothetical protein
MKATVFQSDQCKKTNEYAINLSEKSTNSSSQRGRPCQQLGRGYEFLQSFGKKRSGIRNDGESRLEVGSLGLVFYVHFLFELHLILEWTESE